VQILRALRRTYAHMKFAEFNLRDPFRVLISCIISQRTRDEQTWQASEKLFALADRPQGIARLAVLQIENAIRLAGFFREKAQHIRDASRVIATEHGGKVPADFDELMKLPGVGRKTANIVLSFGFSIPAIAVDVHVHRISNRLGLVETREPEQTEAALAKIVPRRWWIAINDLMVRHGQAVCKPTRPECVKCPVADLCAKRI
jgi:endonuclease-3